MRGLYILKPWYTRRLSAGIDLAVRRGVSPDIFTFFGMLSAALAGAAIAYGWWHIAALFLAGRLAGANLDGAVARARGVSRPWGFVLNEVGDRSSDFLAFAGLAVLAWRTDHIGPSLIWVLVATLAATLPTFVSLSCAGAGAPRLNGGPFGKTERSLAVVIAAAFPMAISWIAMAIVLGSLLTAVLRGWSAHRQIAAQ